jgi:anaerobic selenocysteine-containing dehydrogenase
MAAVLYVLMREKLVDRSFIKKYSVGFEAIYFQTGRSFRSIDISGFCGYDGTTDKPR